MSSILSAIGRVATRYSAARARHRTERALHSLPIELQKDIGWPEASAAGSVEQRRGGTGRG